MPRGTCQHARYGSWIDVRCERGVSTVVCVHRLLRRFGCTLFVVCKAVFVVVGIGNYAHVIGPLVCLIEYGVVFAVAASEGQGVGTVRE